MTQTTELLELATDIAREAGELAARRRRDGVEIAATKSSLADIVTEADREVEVLIRERLIEARPDDGFLGEESAAGGVSEGTSGITWVVDPIDGTVNYAAGIPFYAVSIAAVSGGVDPRTWTTQVGVVAAPATSELFRAARGEGAWLDGRRLAVAERNPAGALIATGFGYDARTHAGDLASLTAAFAYARDMRRMGSAALDLAAVAAGRIDAYFERGLNPWDVAAGELLVTEAGGRFGWISPDGARPMMLAAGPELFGVLADALPV